MDKDILIPDRFSTRAFYIQHLAPYEYAKQFAAGKTVLDAGTGDGYGARYLAKTAKEVIGIDINSQGIEAAQQASCGKNNLKFAINSVLDLDFPDEHFDVVISSQVVEHIELDKLDRYLCEIRRVLKKDGVFFISTLNLMSNLKGKSPHQYDKSPQHIKEFTSQQLKDFLDTRFSGVDILGLRRGPRHAFYNFLKKNKVFDRLPERFNPVSKYYNRVLGLRDFVYTRSGLNSAFDFLGVCRKQ